MSTVELRNKAIELLNGVENESLLQQVIMFLSKSNSSAVAMSPELELALKQSSKSFQDGQYSSHDEVMDRMKTKFPELH